MSARATRDAAVGPAILFGLLTIAGGWSTLIAPVLGGDWRHGAGIALCAAPVAVLAGTVSLVAHLLSRRER